MGANEVQQFLQMLANARRVSVPTHNQALSAQLFVQTMLYTHVLTVAAGGATSPLDALTSQV